MTVRKLGIEEIIWITPPHHCSLLGEVRTGSPTGQKLVGRSHYRGQETLLFIGLFLVACCILTEFRTTSPRVASLTMAWVLPHRPLFKKMSYTFANNLILWRYFPSWGSFMTKHVSSLHIRKHNILLKFLYNLLKSYNINCDTFTRLDLYIGQPRNSFV